MSNISTPDSTAEFSRLEEPKDILINSALIDCEDDNLDVHRLVQTAFLHHLDEEQRNRGFNAACNLLYQAFPKQLFGRPLVGEWPTCLRYAPHVKFIADRYEEFQPSLRANDDFVNLISNCAWYLQEIGETSDCTKLVMIAKDACSDKTSFIYSHLENTLGCCAMELNNLSLCRQCLESSLDIRRRILPKDDEDLLCTMNNYANLQNSIGDHEGSLKLYEEVRIVRESMGEETAGTLALTYMGIGQAQVKLENFVDAEAAYDKAWKIMVKQFGDDGHYIAQYEQHLLPQFMGSLI